MMYEQQDSGATYINMSPKWSCEIKMQP